MKKLLIFVSFFLSLDLYAMEIDNSFITKFEYGAMLYKNPRGVGCIKCHGNKAKGMFIASYKDKKNTVHNITAPDITNLSFTKFKKILTAKKNKSKIMPTYFLTEEELDSLYYFISKQE